jgi:hypothetical protein
MPYDPAGATVTTDGGPGTGGATLSAPPPGPMLRDAAAPNVVRGYPGGMADLAGEPGGHGAGPVAVPGPASGGPAAAVAGEGGSVWQRSLTAWRAAGIDWEPAAAPAPGPEGTGAAAAVQQHAASSPHTDDHTQPALAAPETGAGVAAGGPRGRVALIAVATSVVLAGGTITGIVVARSGGSGGPAFTVEPPYSPVTVATADFAPAAAGTAALLPSLTGVAAAQNTVVAIGAQAGQPFALPLFLYSSNGGRDWARATLTGAGAAPAPGQVPVLLAVNRGNWLALGQRSAWVSPNGRAWQAAPAVPAEPGDTVLGLARARTGFVAVGKSGPGATAHGQPGPVVWTFAAGRGWQRRSGAALGLSARGGGRVVALRWAAYRAQELLIGGEVARPAVRRRGGRKVKVSALAPALWRSKDGGATWQQVRLPAGHGAADQLAGLAAGTNEFVAIRPGRPGTRRRDAMAYVSGRGSAWRYAGRLSAGRRAPLRIAAVTASGEGFAAAGSAGASRVVFVSTTGRGWRRVAGQGMSATRAVAGVTVVAHGTVVTAGARRQPGSGLAGRSPYLLLSRAGASVRPSQAGQAVLSAATADVTVNSVATAGGEQVAAGSAGGIPALWRAPQGGQWVPVAAPVPASWRPGELTSVVRGGAGWLAVGRAGMAAPYHPVIMTSVAGGAWGPAPGSQPLAAPRVTLTQAAAGPAGYVVVGSQASGGQPAAAAWFSASLTTWTRAGVPVAGGRANPGAAGQMLAVTTAGPGFVAAGYTGRAPAVWISRNGSAWRRTSLPVPAGAAGAVLTSVAAANGRLVAAGYESPASGSGLPPGPAPFIAVSGDGGRIWHERALAAAPLPAAVTAVTAARGGFVAAGLTGIGEKRSLAAWWSPDGFGWHGGELGAAGLRGGTVRKITALDANGGVLTGAGYAVTGGGEQPLLWRARYR